MMAEEVEVVQGVWTDLAKLGQVTRPKPYSRDSWVFSLRDQAARAGALQACPRAKVFEAKTGGPMWSETTVSARGKGWKWSGETEVDVYQFTAPSLKDVPRTRPLLQNACVNGLTVCVCV
jgi:hypothetical protein